MLAIVAWLSGLGPLFSSFLMLMVSLNKIRPGLGGVRAQHSWLIITRTIRSRLLNSGETVMPAKMLTSLEARGSAGSLFIEVPPYT